MTANYDTPALERLGRRSTRGHERSVVTLCAVLLALAIGSAISLSGPVSAVLAPAAVAVMLLPILVRSLIRWPENPEAQKRFLRWTFLAFVSHFIFGLSVTNITSVQNVFGGDDRVYHRTAVQILNHWTEGSPFPALPPGKEGYYFLLASLYRLVGPYPEAGLVLNATMAGALVPLVGHLTYTLFGSKAAGYVPPLVVFMPGLFLWTSLLLKEATVLFLIAVAADCAARLTKRGSLLTLVVMTLALSVLFTMRGPIAFVIAIGMIFGLLIGSRRVLHGLATAMIAAAFIAMLVLAVGVGYSGYNFTVQSNLERAQLVRVDLSAANSGFASEVDISTPAKALSYLPLGMVTFMLGPFPWQLGGGRQLLVVPDLLVWWMLIPFLWKGQRRALSLFGRHSLLLAFPALGAAVMLSLTVGNFGTVVRERMQVLILLVPLIALGLALRRKDQKEFASHRLVVEERARAHDHSTLTEPPDRTSIPQGSSKDLL